MSVFRRIEFATLTKLMRILTLIALVLLMTSCSKRITQDNLNGKWQTLVEGDHEYYEVWVSDSLVIWLNSWDFHQTFITELSKNRLNYIIKYDRFDDFLIEYRLTEKLTRINDTLISVEAGPQKSKYRFIKINDEKFEKDFRKLNFDSVQYEFKNRQYKYFGVRK